MTIVTKKFYCSNSQTPQSLFYFYSRYPTPPSVQFSQRHFSPQQFQHQSSPRPQQQQNNSQLYSPTNRGPGFESQLGQVAVPGQNFYQQQQRAESPVKPALSPNDQFAPLSPNKR